MNAQQKEILGCLDQNIWITQNQLLNQLHIKFERTYKPRRLRAIIKECRMLYKEDCIKLLIIKSNRGYKLSTDINEIKCFCNELIETGESMVREAKEIQEAADRKTLVTSIKLNKEKRDN